MRSQRPHSPTRLEKRPRHQASPTDALAGLARTRFFHATTIAVRRLLMLLALTRYGVLPRLSGVLAVHRHGPHTGSAAFVVMRQFRCPPVLPESYSGTRSAYSPRPATLPLCFVRQSERPCGFRLSENLCATSAQTFSEPSAKARLRPWERDVFAHWVTRARFGQIPYRRTTR
jgi:hypothetical protein